MKKHKAQESDGGQPHRLAETKGSTRGSAAGGRPLEDIEDIREAREALRESEERYRSLFNGMTEGFALHEILCDEESVPRDYRFLAVNPAFERLTGLKRQDVIGATHSQVLPNDDPKWVRIYGEVALTGNPVRFENYSPALQRHYEVFAYRPAPRQFAVLFTDITERKEWDARVESMARFPAENTNPVLRADADGRLLYANEASQAVLREWKTKLGSVLPSPWAERVVEALKSRAHHDYEAEADRRAFSFNMVPLTGAGYVNIYGTDVTALRDAQRREAEALAGAAAAEAARAALTAMEESVLLMDMSGTITYVNPALVRLAGHPRDEIVRRAAGEFLSQVLSPEDLSETIRGLDSLRQGIRPETRPLTLRSRDGRTVPVVSSASFIRGADGTPVSVVLTMRDISQLKEAEAELRSANVLLERIFDNTHMAIVYLDREFKFVRVNRTYAEACQRPVESLVGKNHFELYPNAENELIFRRVLQTGEPFLVHEKPFEFPDHPEWGITYWDWSLQPIKDARGAVEGLVFCLRDVTPRKRAQLALEASETKYRELVENANSIIMRLATDGRITFFNEYAEQFLGYREEEILGQNVLGTVFPETDSRGQRMDALVREVGENPEAHPSLDSEAICKDGRRVWVHWANRALRSERGDIIEALCIGTDATARKRTEERDRAITALLALFASKTSRQDYLDAVVAVLRDWSGCRCVGVRLLDSEGRIPYESSVGLSQEFRDLENRLSIHTDACSCVRVITQRFEVQDQPIMSTGGSLRCNQTPEFLTSLSPAERARYRGNCARFGFHSLAVVPLRFRDRVLGALHLADERTGAIPQETLEFVEMISPIVGEAIHRFNVERDLRESGAYNRRLIEAGLDPLVTIAPDGRIADVNAALEAATGRFRSELVGSDFADHFTEPEKARAGFEEAFREGLVRDYPLELRHCSGRVMSVLYNASVYHDEAGNVVGVFAAARDMTERNKLEAERMRYQERLRSLADRLATTEEEGRRRLSRLIHDTVIQDLSLSSIKLGAVRESLVRAAMSEDQARLDAVRGLIEGGIRQCRSLMSDLTPPMLYEIGLGAALEDLAGRTEQQHGIRVRVEDRLGNQALDQSLRGLLFQSASEFVVNALKHAAPSQIVISARVNGDTVCVSVQDDGVGFDPAALASSRGGLSGGFGLFNIRERVEGLGGRCEVFSEPGKGTVASVAVPLQRRGPAREAPAS